MTLEAEITASANGERANIECFLLNAFGPNRLDMACYSI